MNIYASDNKTTHIYLMLIHDKFKCANVFRM